MLHGTVRCVSTFGLSSNSMAVVDVDTIAAYLGRLATLFCIHQTNRMNSRNVHAMMIALVCHVYKLYIK